MNLCLICLRTDKFLNIANETLKEFHNDLCDFSILTMTSSCYYCNECEYVLRKFYKFKEKCVKALKIYEKWKSMKMRKNQPMNVLYILLPPSSLGIWNNSEKIANFTVQNIDDQTIFVESISMNDLSINVKQEYDQTDNINYINTDIESKNISENVSKSEHVDEIKNYTDNEEQILSDNFEEFSDDDSTTSVVNKNKTCNIKMKNHVEKGELLSIDLQKLSDDSEMINDDDSNTKIITKFESEGCDKKAKILGVSKKKKENLSEKDVNPTKCHGKKITAKMKAYYDKAKRNDKMYESVFDIEYLTTQEMKLDEFEKRKTYECYVKAEHKCEICYQTFKSMKFLQYHTNKWHTERPGSVYCPICKIWSSKSSSHRLTHTMVFKCKQCPLVTYHRLSMQNHYEWHRGKQYRCDECDYNFKSKSAYQTHMGKIHRRGHNVCEGCGRGFRSPLGLQIHRSNTFRCTLPKDTTEGVKCDECDVTLPTQEVYETHVSDVHKLRLCKERPPTASGTGIPQPRFIRRTPKSYKKRRTKPFQLTCRLCNTGLLGWCQLQQHFKKEHPTDDMSVLYADKAKHLCDICGAGFSQVYSLRDHMNKHTGERPFACDLCPKRFRSSYLRKEHRLRHFPSTISCSHCGKQFKTKGNLYFHLKTHTGEKDHKCDICGKGFIQRTNLNEHIRGVHYNIRRKRGERTERS